MWLIHTPQKAVISELQVRLVSVVICDECVTGGWEKGQHRSHYVFFSGMKGFGTWFFSLFIFSSQETGLPRKLPKVLLINTGVGIQYSPKHSSPVKGCVFQCGLGQEGPTRFWFIYGWTIKWQSLRLSGIENNAPERGLYPTAPEANLIGHLTLR